MVVCISCFNSCAMGGKPIRFPERKAQDKMWRPCQNKEVKDYIGKFCNRVCIKRKRKSCKLWKTNVKDFTIEKDFLFFRNNGMILIDEKYLLN